MQTTGSLAARFGRCRLVIRYAALGYRLRFPAECTPPCSGWRTWTIGSPASDCALLSSCSCSQVELAASGDIECWHPIGNCDDEYELITIMVTEIGLGPPALLAAPSKADVLQKLHYMAVHASTITLQTVTEETALKTRRSS
jgi:hypothetical protein